MKLKEWGMFVLLGLVWGSSFLWIKVGEGNGGQPFLGIAFPPGAPVFRPFLLVACRVMFGVLGMAAVVLFKRESLPRDPQTLAKFAFMGVFNTAVPFTLFSWGETRIDSGLASIYNGTLPLFITVIAHFWLDDERINRSRFVGLMTGFAGVAVLVSRDLGASAGSDVWGQLGVMAAVICYAVSAVFSRKYLRGQSPIAQSFMVLLVAFAFMAVAVPIVEQPVVLPTPPIAWFAVAWLGLLGSCLAYLLYFSLMNAWGVTRAALVSYVFPVVGLILGITLLDEALDWRLFVGTALVVAGIVAVNFQTFAQLLPWSGAPVARAAMGD
jgi:drug/metabolite transporter (DMT)-like permease